MMCRSPRSSAGQSDGLLSRGSQVRVLPGALSTHPLAAITVPPRDRVKELIVRAGRAPEGVEAVELLRDLEALPPRELVRFDVQSRSWFSGLSAEGIAQAAQPARGVLGLVSRDGRERERAIGAARLSPLTARLLALRCTDWVNPVRAAALERLGECPLPLLVEALLTRTPRSR